MIFVVFLTSVVTIVSGASTEKNVTNPIISPTINEIVDKSNKLHNSLKEDEANLRWALPVQPSRHRNNDQESESHSSNSAQSRIPVPHRGIEITSTTTIDVSPFDISTALLMSSNVSSIGTQEEKEQSSTAAVKPTKYYYYPHNQHIYLLPECAIQQVCNAVYVRLNYTQPLCACPSRYKEPCSASLNGDDLHTTQLSTDKHFKSSKVLTLVKTCEPVGDMRLCRMPRDWSLLALQNIRTGKSHYLVICRCPESSVLEGPMSHDQPTYASVPGIRVYGMVCVNKSASATSSPVKRKARPLTSNSSNSGFSYADSGMPTGIPWRKVKQLLKYVV